MAIHTNICDQLFSIILWITIINAESTNTNELSLSKANIQYTEMDNGESCCYSFANKESKLFTQQSMYKLLYEMSQQNTRMILLGDSVTRRCLFTLHHILDKTVPFYTQAFHTSFKYQLIITKSNQTYHLLNPQTNNHKSNLIRQIAKQIAQQNEEIIIQSEWKPLLLDIEQYFMSIMKNNESIINKNEKNERFIFVVGVGAHDLKAAWTKSTNIAGAQVKFISMWQNFINFINQFTDKYKGKVKIVFRTQTVIPKDDELVVIWNKIMKDNINKYKSNNIYIYDVYNWSRTSDIKKYEELIKVKNKINNNENEKKKVWNGIRNKCTQCDDFVECVHHTDNGRNMLLQQTLKVIQLVFNAWR